jgi:hypothetical protein
MPTIVITEPSHPIEESKSPTTTNPITQPSCPANILEEQENIPPHVTIATPAPIKITVPNLMLVVHIAFTGVTNFL